MATNIPEIPIFVIFMVDIESSCVVDRLYMRIAG
jgi:hypothetical protein